MSLFSRNIRLLLLILPAWLVLLFGLKHPLYNWDMIGYVAAAYYKEGYRGAELHHRTYTDIKNAAKEEDFIALTKGLYRETVFKSPESLEQHVPFYSIRTLYITCMQLLKKCHISYSKATYFLSAFFTALSVLVLGKIFLAKKISMFVLPVAVLLLNFAALARLSTPDTMACFFSLLTCYLLLSEKKVGYFIAAVLPLIRTDFVLLPLCLSGYAYRKKNKSVAFLIGATAVILMLFIHHWHNSYRWVTLFNFTLFEYMPYPAKLVPSVEFGQYLHAYLRGFKGFLMHPHALIYFIALYCFFCTSAQLGKEVVKEKHGKDKAIGRDTHAEQEREKDNFLLLILPLLFVATHLLLFPHYLERWFIFPVSLVFTWVLNAKKINPL